MLYFVFASVSTSWSTYVICFFTMIFIFITINHTLSLTKKNLFFGQVCQKFSLGVFLSFCLIFCQFQAGFAYKSVAYKKSMYYLPWSHVTDRYYQLPYNDTFLDLTLIWVGSSGVRFEVGGGGGITLPF